MANNSLKMWAQENNKLYAQAIETMASYIIEELEIETIEDYEDCKNEIETTTAQYWREWLEDDLRVALEDKIAVAMVVDKDCYGGGGFEAERDIQIDTRNKVKEIINNN